MKKTAKLFLLAILAFAIILPLGLGTQAAHAQTGYTIEHVNHNVQVLFSGHTVVSETIQLSGQMPDNFLIGFPIQYSASILKAQAYDANYRILPVTLGVQMQSESGFYGTRVSLPAGTTQTFTIFFTFQNTLVKKATNGIDYTLSFPGYPSFTQPATDCNVTLVGPYGVIVESIDKPDGAINGTAYDKPNLEEFTYAPATATLTPSYGNIALVDIPSINRQVNIGANGALTSTDSYRITNPASNTLSYFLINLPLNATGIAARDDLGRVLTASTLTTNSVTQAINVTFVEALDPGESSGIKMDYSLPSISPQQPGKFLLNLDQFPYFNYYVDSASVTVTPPEGAVITSPQLSSLGPSDSLERNVFQESLTINKGGVSFVDSTAPARDIIQIACDYSSLWIAFRPTSWMWAAAIVGCVIGAVWTRPKVKMPAKLVAPKMAVGLSPENLKSLADSYEEKNRLTSELESLEARAQRGRIPRRRYKVQRRTLEMRLDTLSKNIAEQKSILRSAGGGYADLVRQLEKAEVDLNEAEIAIKNLEAKHELGELPLDAYKKQLTDMERRKQKAESAISGLLLRLREEIR